MRQARRGTALWGIVVFALALWACETTRNPGGIQRDVTAPAIQLTNTVGDTQAIGSGLRFNVAAIDNLALKSVSSAKFPAPSVARPMIVIPPPAPEFAGKLIDRATP